MQTDEPTKVRFDKVATLIGFAVKANKLIYGLEELEKGKRKRYLIVCCHSLGAKSRETAEYIARRDGVPIVVTENKLLEDIVHKNNCKIIGIANKQMSEAIMKFLSDEIARPEGYSLIKSEEI